MDIILTTMSRCRNIDFIVPEKLLSIGMLQKFVLMYLARIREDHRHSDVNNFHNSFGLVIVFKSMNLRSPMPPSNFGLHKISHDILCNFPF